jgi:hypothetical protein
MPTGMAEVVDVVAAAARVCPPVPGTVRNRPEPQPETPRDPGRPECPLGHANVGAPRYCAECGMPMDEVKLTQRVDLDAVRMAMQAQPQTPEAQAARDREHAEAIAASARFEQSAPDISQVADPSQRKILIHFVTDGFTWKKVWLRGEMLEIGPDHPWWDSAQSWIKLTKVEQFHRYGRVFFDFGPYPGAVPKPGTEVLLPSAPVGLWAEARGAVPARSGPEGNGSLVPW